MTPPLFRVHRLRKEFAGNAVLRDVDAEIGRGEILALIGENGAGKSTFMKILSGIYEPTSGTLELEGKPIAFDSPSDARRAGASIVRQEFNLAEGLSAAHRQLVEVCEALAFDASLLILDELTTVLTGREIDRLFALMRSLKARGMALIYVSHKLAEVKAICDRVIVLKDGELVREAPIAEIEPPEMARAMVGRELREIFPPKRKAVGPLVLEVKGLSSPGAFTDVSFTVREGEILGFAGLVGAGRTQIAEALMGLRPSSGVVRVGGKEARARDAKQAVRQGFGYLSEDRQGSGILTGFGIAENMTLVSLRDYTSLPFVIDRDKEVAKARTWRDRFGIKASNLAAPLESLSGGNQQKVFLAKTLDPGPRVVIVDEPTRGVDVAAKQEIYRFLAELAAKGAAVVLISSELEEIIGMCDRVVVMREGRIAGELEGNHVEEREIMYMATGLHTGANA